MKCSRNVLLVFGRPFPANDAPSSRISSLVTSLSERGHSVQVACSWRIKNSSAKLNREVPGATLPVLVPINGANAFSRIASSVLNLLSSFLFSFALPSNYDAVILSVPPSESAFGFHLGLTFRLFMSHKKPKLVYDYRDDILDESRYTDYYRSKYEVRYVLMRLLLHVMTILIQRSDAIVCTTEAHRAILIQRAFDAKKVHVIHNGADLTQFKPPTETEKVSLRLKYGIPLRAFVLVGVSGGLWLSYNLKPFIAAVRLLRLQTGKRATNFLLLLVGEKSLELQDTVRSALRDRLIDLGEIAHSEIPDVLRAADLGIIPRAEYDFLKHTLPTKLFEYCACGLPLLATVPTGTLTETMIHNNSLGFVFRPEDITGLAEAIMRLSEDDDLRSKVSSRCRATAERQFDRRMLSAGYVSIVEDALGH